MSFDLELLKQELSKYGTIIDCSIYFENTLEIYVKNATGRQTTYDRIETDYILPYYDKVTSRFTSGYYKSGFLKKE